jgi:hypothetical protein
MKAGLMFMLSRSHESGTSSPGLIDRGRLLRLLRLLFVAVTSGRHMFLRRHTGQDMNSLLASRPPLYVVVVKGPGLDSE